ncbi:MAG TPA: SAM-dependent chlorinase/fluorinase [Bacteroidales bacterium]|nr:SAM-dependent chlorinase/fluorinase [Bacteroidales bacterium]
MITLTTDFGLRDEYVGLMKGVINSINPMVPIIDLTHHITPQDVNWTSYLIYYSFLFFPPGSIHVVVVDPGVGSSRKIKLVKAADHYFLCPDNGLISKVAGFYKPEEIWDINNRRYFLDDISSTFHGRDIFAPVAGHLSVGVKPELLGNRTNELLTFVLPEPAFTEPQTIEGNIIHVDQFGNLITNIEEQMIRRLNIRYKDVLIEVAGQTIAGISKSYIMVGDGELLSTIGSKGLLEISVNKGNAESSLGLGKGERIRIKG